jgi:molybdopterin converting factor small subunit
MNVEVRLFAGLRERAGWNRRTIDAATVADVWPALGLGEDEPAGLLYAVNREYAEPDRELRDGDEVALIPPVSGGSFHVTEDRLSLDTVVARSRTNARGRSRPSPAPCAGSPAAVR